MHCTQLSSQQLADVLQHLCGLHELHLYIKVGGYSLGMAPLNASCLFWRLRDKCNQNCVCESRNMPLHCRLQHVSAVQLQEPPAHEQPPGQRYPVLRQSATLSLILPVLTSLKRLNVTLAAGYYAGRTLASQGCGKQLLGFASSRILDCALIIRVARHMHCTGRRTLLC